MTAKNMKQAHKDLCALCGDLHDKGMDPINALELEQHATAIRAALAPFDQSAGWLPICVAPKDGTAILAIHERNVARMMYVCWRATHDSSCHDAEQGQYKVAAHIREQGKGSES